MLGDRRLGSLGLSVVQCMRKTVVVLSVSQKHRHSLKHPKKKECFHGIFCLAAHTVVYDTPENHKTSNSQTSHPRLLCHRLQQHKSMWLQEGLKSVLKTVQICSNLEKCKSNFVTEQAILSVTLCRTFLYIAAASPLLNTIDTPSQRLPVKKIHTSIVGYIIFENDLMNLNWWSSFHHFI